MFSFIYIFHLTNKFGFTETILDSSVIWGLLLSTRSFPLSRRLPPSSSPHPLQPWHGYIIAFGKLCDTPTPSNLKSHSSVMSEAEETRFPDRLITVCFVTALWNIQLLSSVPSKEKKKLIPPNQRLNLRVFVFNETPDKIGCDLHFPFYQFSTILHNFSYRMHVCLCAFSPQWAHCFLANEALSVLGTWLKLVTYCKT